MSGLIKPLLRRVLQRARPARRPTHGNIVIVRSAPEARATALRIGRSTSCSSYLVRNCLDRLLALDGTTLYVQVTQPRTPFDILLTPHGAASVTASVRGQKLRIDTEQDAPNGAYLIDRQYRRLGFYETPPGEPAVVVVDLQFRSEPVFLIDYPAHVNRVTVVANGRPLALAARLPAAGELRLQVAKVR